MTLRSVPPSPPASAAAAQWSEDEQAIDSPFICSKELGHNRSSIRLRLEAVNSWQWRRRPTPNRGLGARCGGAEQQPEGAADQRAGLAANGGAKGQACGGRGGRPDPRSVSAKVA